MRNTALLIAGPTASGKSALAVALARQMGGVVINTDSMQVYSDLRILTARPSQEEDAAAPHALYGHVDGAVNYSAGHFARDVAPLLQHAQAERRMPILVGGTGLYFKALTQGLSDMPVVPQELRDRVRRDAAGKAAVVLHGELALANAEAAAAVLPTDTQRILRALEIIAATGHAPSHFHAMRVPGPLSGWRQVAVFLAPERAALHEAINDRFRAMLAAGALDEVAALAQRGLDPALPLMRAHGVPALMAHLRGEMALEDAISRGQADTRAYVKRQFTWFRQQMPAFVAVEPTAAPSAVMDALQAAD
jgi:tRNA dimethylallyltransferase